MSAPLEVKLANLEGKLDAYFARLEERMEGLEKRLHEKFNGHESRLLSLETSMKHQGERLGMLETARSKAEGGLWATVKLIGVGGALGGILAKGVEWWKG